MIYYNQLSYLFFFIVIMEKTSLWFKRTIESLKYANKSLKNISNKKREPRLPRITSLQKRMNIISTSYSYDKGLPSSSSSLTPFVQVFHPAVAYCLRSSKKVEKKDYEPPPRKRIALAKRTGQGALNKPEVRSMSLMQSILQDERFRNLELPKLVEEEKMRASNDDVDLTIDRTVDEQKVKLIARNRFRSLHRSGKIHIRSSKTNPYTLVNIIFIIAVCIQVMLYIYLFVLILGHHETN